jgi:FixJ family two-component response regulator
MNGKPVVHVVDDDSDFRKSVSRLLHLSGFETAQYASAGQLLEQLDPDAPGCVLLDLDMPVVNGLQLQTRLTEMDAPLAIVFLSGRGTIPASVKAVKAGAEDFLCKPIAKHQLIEAVERAISRNQKTREFRAKADEFHARCELLTPREKQVYERVITGKLNKQIAYDLSTTERTIKAHRHNVMAKLQARSILELVWMSEHLTTLNLPESVA